MGAVPAGVVEATFFNFHPRRVRRAIPDAWAIAQPADVVQTRAVASAAALRRLLPNGDADRLADSVIAMLRAAIDAADNAGRPLFGANRDVPTPDDPVAALWQAATTLREHRGDGHVALLTGADLDGCEAHVLFAAGEGLDPELFQESRGWSIDDWTGASERLSERGMTTPDGSLTSVGQHLREQIESATDTLAVSPYANLGDDRVRELLATLSPAAHRIDASGALIFPNPMGLPAPNTA
jgi:hypothetical protein